MCQRAPGGRCADDTCEQNIKARAELENRFGSDLPVDPVFAARVQAAPTRLAGPHTHDPQERRMTIHRLSHVATSHQVASSANSALSAIRFLADPNRKPIGDLRVPIAVR